MNIREFENMVRRKLSNHRWLVEREGWKAGRTYREPTHISRIGLRPQTIIDMGLADGTPQLYAAFRDARLILPAERDYSGNC